MNKRSRLYTNYEYQGSSKWRLGNYTVIKFANYWKIEGLDIMFPEREDMETYIINNGKNQVENELEKLGLNKK